MRVLMMANPNHRYRMESPTKRAYRLRDEVTQRMFDAAVLSYGRDNVRAVDNKTIRIRFPNPEGGGPCYTVVTTRAEP